MERAPRLSSITGVSRALISTVGVEDAVGILISQFGWDTAFNAIAAIEGVDGEQGLWQALSVLTAGRDD